MRPSHTKEAENEYNRPIETFDQRVSSWVKLFWISSVSNRVVFISGWPQTFIIFSLSLIYVLKKYIITFSFLRLYYSVCSLIIFIFNILNFYLLFLKNLSIYIINYRHNNRNF